jgi:hypothetical protein
MYIQYTSTLSGGRTYLVEEEVILVGDQQDGGKKRQISTLVSKCILCYCRCFIEMCALIP